MIIFIQTMLMLITFGQFSLYNITYVDRTIDTPIVELNNHTLREVFEGGNLVVNGDFSDGSNGWILLGMNGSVSNGIYSLTSYTQGGSLRYINETTISKFYAIARVKTDSNLVLLAFKNGSNYIDLKYHSGSNSYQNLSNVFNTTIANVNDFIYVGDNRISGWTQIDVDYIYLYNLNILGISSLTVEQMDSYFNEYQELKEVSEHSYTYTINEVTLTDFMVVLSSAVIWFFIIKFLKEVF